MIEFITDNILLTLVLPLWAALILMFNSYVNIVEPKKTTLILTLCSTLVGLLFSAVLMLNFINGTGIPVFEANVLWFSAGDVNFYLGVLIDKISVLFLLILMSVSLIVQIYSYGYMQNDENFGRYYAYLNLFNFSMAGLILSSNLIQTYIFWELVGVCSYLLIGFWFQKYTASKAAQKAFIVNRIGDCGFLAGIICFIYFSVTYLNIHGAEFLAYTSLQGLSEQIYALTTEPLFFVICLLILLGALAKSAQFPLHIWLADAMEAPTPVSALIHAATMVAAGIYLVVRMYPLFTMSPEIMNTILCIGFFTAFITAYFALTQTDIKKMLAYSTSSQLGIMFIALGLAVPSAALYHLTTHAFTKALLFLTAGVIILYLHHNQDMREMGGLRRKLPFAAICYLTGALSLTGLMFSGYFSKESIFNHIYQTDNITFICAFLVISFMTAFYIFKSYFLVFEGASQKEYEHNNVPKSMNLSLFLLLIPTLCLGFLINKNFEHFFDVYKNQSVHIGSYSLVAASVIMALIAAVLAYIVVKSNKNTSFLPKFLYKLSYRKFYIDELNTFFTDKVFGKICIIFDLIDRYVIDGIVKLIAICVRSFAWLVAKFQNGNFQTYLAYSIFIIGVIMFFVVRFYFWFLEV